MDLDEAAEHGQKRMHLRGRGRQREETEGAPVRRAVAWILRRIAATTAIACVPAVRRPGCLSLQLREICSLAARSRSRAHAGLHCRTRSVRAGGGETGG